MNNLTLLKAGFWTLIYRVIGAGLAFASTLLFARILEVDEFGLFSLGLTIVTILSVFVRAGQDNVALKQVAAHLHDQQQISDGYIYHTILLVTFVGLLASLTLWNVSDAVSQNIFNKPKLTTVIRSFSFLIIPISLVFLSSEINKSLGKAPYSAFFQVVFPPCLTLAIVALLWQAQQITLSWVISAVVIGFTGSMLIFIFGLRTHLLSPQKTQISYLHLLKQGIPMLLVTAGSLIISWSDIIILGIFTNSKDVGLYSAASRAVMITTLILFAINTVTAPKYAKLYKNNNINEIEDLANKSSAIAFSFIIIPTCILLIFPDWVMQLFGAEYLAGTSILMILAIGQFVNVACGSVGYLLTMTGKEKTLRNIIFTSAFINIVLNIFLFYQIGVIGIACATAFSVILWNIWAMYEVKKHLNFWSINIVSAFRR